MMISIVDESPLIDGVNDAVVQTVMQFQVAKDETEFGIGKSWIDIIESGWSWLPGTKALSEALASLG